MSQKLQIELSDELVALLDQLAADQDNPLRRRPTEIELAAIDAMRKFASEQMK
jgi:predicted transcriptional regulator